MKKIVVVLILISSINLTYSQIEPEDFTREFFTLLEQQKYSEAIENLPASNSLKNDTAFTTKLEVKLRTLNSKRGEFCGYEFIDKEEVSPSYIIYNYLIKYLDSPQRIQFIYYRPKNQWILLQLNLNVQNRQDNPARKQGFKQRSNSTTMPK